MIRLWTINRFLRWTGFRAAVYVNAEARLDEHGDPYVGYLGGTMVGVFWVGLPGSKGWDLWSP